MLDVATQYETYRAIRARLWRPKISPPVVAAPIVPLPEIDAASRAEREEAFNEVYLETRSGQFGRFQRIVLAACRHFDLPRAHVLSNRRGLRMIYARQVIMYLACWHTALSTPTIGRLIDRDHTSVIHGRDKIKRLIGRGDAQVVADVRKIERNLGFT